MDLNRWEKPVTRREIFKTVADHAFNLPNHKIDTVAFASQLDAFDPDDPATWGNKVATVEPSVQTKAKTIISHSRGLSHKGSSHRMKGDSDKKSNLRGLLGTLSKGSISRLKEKIMDEHRSAIGSAGSVESVP